MAIPVLWAARKAKFLTRPPLLVHVDAHTDWAEESVDYRELVSRVHTLEDAILCANALPRDDGGWVDFVLKCGWITRMVTLFANHDELQNPHEQLLDISGTPRSFVGCTATGSAFSHRADESSPSELAARLASEFESWNAETDDPIWLDIDLDFAVPQFKSSPIPRNFDDLRSWFDEPILSQANSRSRHSVMNDLLQTAQLITIATEPEYCGGFAGVASVLESLAKLFPKHERKFRWFD